MNRAGWWRRVVIGAVAATSLALGGCRERTEPANLEEGRSPVSGPSAGSDQSVMTPEQAVPSEGGTGGSGLEENLPHPEQQQRGSEQVGPEKMNQQQLESQGGQTHPGASASETGQSGTGGAGTQQQLPSNPAAEDGYDSSDNHGAGAQQPQ